MFPHLDEQEPPGPFRIRYESIQEGGLWRESEVFFRRLGRSSRGTVFENSAANVRIRRDLDPSPDGAGERPNLVVPSGTTFEHKLKVQGLPARRVSGTSRQPVLHGEFDPGSGRTLAARLTHASRARTDPPGSGKAANG